MALGTVQKSVMRNVYIAKSWLFPPWIEQSMLRTELDRLRADIAARMPGNPAASGYKVYSQTDEDGIIDAIFRVLGEGERRRSPSSAAATGSRTTRTRCSCAAGAGCGSTARARTSSSSARHFPLSTPRLSVEQQFITRENAYPVVRDALAKLEGAPTDVDLLSIDLDGNDAIILDQMLAQMSPRVVLRRVQRQVPLAGRRRDAVQRDARLVGRRLLRRLARGVRAARAASATGSSPAASRASTRSSSAPTSRAASRATRPRTSTSPHATT